MDVHIKCVFTSILLIIADDFIVCGTSGPLVAPLGSSVVLPCYVDEPLPMKDLKVEWRRTDSETLVHLYEDGVSRAEEQQQEYQDRAHFFTDQIQHGNFSLRLDNLRTEDKGIYRCKVYSQQFAYKTLVEIKDVEYLLVSGSSRSISASVGEDVTLNCSVDSHIKPEHIEEVSWRKTDEDEDIPVLLYQNNEAFPDSSDEQFRDRVEFFTDEIPKGNFSLRLKSVRTEDKGVYICQVFAGILSANATVVLEQLDFSTLHLMLFFCIAAASGAALLLCCLIYCRSNNTVNSRTIWNLQVSLVFCPNISMFLAFIFWGLTDGFQTEIIICCALNILRFFMLIWAFSYLNYLQDNLKTWIRFSSRKKELAVFTIVVYSVFFIDAWKKSAHKTSSRRIILGFFGGFVVLLSFVLSRGFIRMHIKWVLLYFLSLAQFLLLISSFGLPNPAFLAVPLVQSMLLLCIHTILWRSMITLYIILVVYVHVSIFGGEKEYLQWICLVLFLEVLRIMVAFEDPDHVIEAEHSEAQRRQQTDSSQQGSNTLPLCYEIMFGAVGLVLLNSVTLTAELILKARNHEHVVKDLRVIVFFSECIFALYWMFLQICAFLKNKPEFTFKQGNSLRRRRCHFRNKPSELHEMENLSAP